MRDLQRAGPANIRGKSFQAEGGAWDKSPEGKIQANSGLRMEASEWGPIFWGEVAGQEGRGQIVKDS